MKIPSTSRRLIQPRLAGLPKGIRNLLSTQRFHTKTHLPSPLRADLCGVPQAELPPALPSPPWRGRWAESTGYSAPGRQDGNWGHSLQTEVPSTQLQGREGALTRPGNRPKLTLAPDNRAKALVSGSTQYIKRKDIKGKENHTKCDFLVICVHRRL